jgi:hypothetical protein
VTTDSAKQTAYLNYGVLHSLDAMKKYLIIIDSRFRAEPKTEKTTAEAKT